MPALRRVLLKRLAEQPVAVICDLSGLWSVDEACAAVFASVANHPASRWPETNLLLCCAQPAVAAVLERLRTPQFLPMHATVEDALTHAVARPPYLRAELAPGPSPTARRPPAGSSVTPAGPGGWRRSTTLMTPWSGSGSRT